MTQPAIVEAQKWLERILDWVFYRWANWANIGREITVDDMEFVSWSFPQMDDYNETEHQNAIAQRLKNHTISYREIYGADWKDKLLEIRDEINWFKDNGLLHGSL